MTDTPNPDSAVAPDAKPQKPWLDLATLYPACFNWKQPRPLKIGIREDLLAAGHDPKMIHRTLAKYCARRLYLKVTLAGMPRLDAAQSSAPTTTPSCSFSTKPRLLQPVIVPAQSVGERGTRRSRKPGVPPMGWSFRRRSRRSTSNSMPNVPRGAGERSPSSSTSSEFLMVRSSTAMATRS
nr:ProQ/FINO family protein [Allochromatium palmeri]